VRGRLTTRVLVASGLLVVLVSAAFAVLLVAIDDMRDSARLVRHSRTELAAANRVEKLVIDLETGERGFVITHRESFLAPWHAARRRIPSDARRLVSITDDPRQKRRASAIARSVNSYVRHYSVPVVDLARSRDPSATSVAVTAQGKRLVDAIRARFDRYVDSERQLAETLQADADANARDAVIAASVGLVGSFVLVALFASYIARAIVLPVRRAAGMAKRLAGGDLSVRMRETGAGEIGDLERAFNTMGSSLESSDAELRRVADEQAALRRVATLVARGVPPDQLLKRVVGEVGGLIGADATALLRYEPDGAATSLAEWSETGSPPQLGRVTLDADSISARVLSTGRAATKASYEGAPGSAEARMREHGIRSSVAAPIVVGGRLWGVMIASWTEERPASPEIQERMAEFIELVATAIANAESRAELTASRARVVAAADETRRRIERDLHDGTQQRLISVGLEMRAAEAQVPPELTDLKAQLASAGKSLTGAVEELQEISRGIHPAILTRGGLRPALKTLARRSPVPVELHVSDDRRLPRPLEVAAYYIVSEALTNAAKHAGATELTVDMSAEDGFVRLSIADDGVGGADPARGSGLVGLKDRVEALRGTLEIASAPGGGTMLRATIPIPPAE
jgi:signal transduction histidine kinase/CHASE3 domain sensor protein